MKLSLSEISTVNTSFAEDVAAYAAAGFAAIGIWEFKLPADDEANVELVREHGLAVANCVPAIPSILPLAIPGLEGPADPEERIEALCASVLRFAPYAPDCVVCLAGPAVGRTTDEAREVVAAGLTRIAAVARDAGVRLGFEPIHPAERDSTGFVNTAADAARLLDEAGLDDVGLMVDTYNLAEDEDAVAWLRANGNRITGVHVADVPTRGLGRALPGTVGKRTRELVAAARAGGWDGPLDVEIFSTPDGFWGLPLAEAARSAHDAAFALL